MHPTHWGGSSTWSPVFPSLNSPSWGSSSYKVNSVFFGLHSIPWIWTITHSQPFEVLPSCFLSWVFSSGRTSLLHLRPTGQGSRGWGWRGRASESSCWTQSQRQVPSRLLVQVRSLSVLSAKGQGHVSHPSVLKKTLWRWWEWLVGVGEDHRTGDSPKEEGDSLICSFFWFPQCKFSHHDGFRAGRVMSLYSVAQCYTAFSPHRLNNLNKLQKHR